MSTDAARRARRWPVVVLVLVVVTAALCTPIFLPPADEYDAADVDAVFILGPPTRERIAEADRIASTAGGAPVYLSVWSGVECAPRFRCVHADPWNTAGEAKALAEAVRDDGVRRPVVVTGTTHVMRARFVFGQCVPVATPIVGVPDSEIPELLTQPVYQWAAMVKAVVAGCAGGTADSHPRG